MPQDLINAKPAALRCVNSSARRSCRSSWTRPTRCPKITHKRRLSALGPGGLTRERAGFEVRDVHPTHYGRICPIETPEGPNIGLINSLATFARVNKYGFIETHTARLRRQGTDEVVYLSAMEESATPWRRPTRELTQGQFVNDLVSPLSGDDTCGLPRRRPDRRFAKAVGSVAASLIPFLENDDANRALMGSNMQRQAVPLVRAEAPLSAPAWKPCCPRLRCADWRAAAGVIDQVDATRIVVRATETRTRRTGVDIYRLRSSSVRTRTPASTSVRW